MAGLVFRVWMGVRIFRGSKYHMTSHMHVGGVLCTNFIASYYVLGLQKFELKDTGDSIEAKVRPLQINFLFPVHCPHPFLACHELFHY